MGRLAGQCTVMCFQGTSAFLLVFARAGACLAYLLPKSPRSPPYTCSPPVRVHASRHLIVDFPHFLSSGGLEAPISGQPWKY